MLLPVISELHRFWLSGIFPRQSSKSGYAKHIGSLWEALRAQSEDWVTISVHDECALHHLRGDKLHAIGSKRDGTKWTRLQQPAKQSGLWPPNPYTQDESEMTSAFLVPLWARELSSSGQLCLVPQGQAPHHHCRPKKFHHPGGRCSQNLGLPVAARSMLADLCGGYWHCWYQAL